MKPFCFVLMPFGKKTDETGRAIDFDQVYETIIRPGVQAADLEAIRADEEASGGFIHKPMFERLMLCDYAVADLTTANPNVFYELGIRHGVRPHSTVLLFSRGLRLPFDVAPLRALPYTIDASGAPTTIAADRDALTTRLIECRNPVEDSPLFQLLTDLPRPDIARLKTDTFRELVEYSQKYKTKLAAARKQGSEAVTQIEKELNVKDTDPALVVDLFLSHRAVENWQGMVDLVPRMSPPLARTVLVREQMGLALNRLGKRDEAEEILLRLIEGRLASKVADYWDFATLLELAVLRNDRREAEAALADTMAAIRESWEPKSTANNLAMIREKRNERKQDVAWIAEIERELTRRAGSGS